MKKLPYKLCRICGKIILGYKRKDRNAFYYPRQCKNCYKKCKNEELRRQRMSNAFKGIKHPRSLALGSTRIVYRNNKPYRQIKTKESGKCWEYEHRYIIEKEFKIKLNKSVHIHHIDGDSLNNNISNLKVITAAEHNKIHHSITQWSKKHNYCMKCKTNLRPHVGNGLCTKCYQSK